MPHDWLQYGAVGLVGLIIVLVLRPLVLEAVAAIRRVAESFIALQHDLLGQQREAAEQLRATVSGKFDAIAVPLAQSADQQRQMAVIWSNGKCPMQDPQRPNNPTGGQP